MPTRVLRVGLSETPPSLFVTKGLSGRYAALSYCWGPVKHTTTLRRHNLEDFQKGMDLSSLCRTHQEAIAVARELDMEYIWIDALCIIQGDKEDWAAEAVKMAEVYGNAYVTIIAGSSSDSRNGFLDPPSMGKSLSSHLLAYSRHDRPETQLGMCYARLPRARTTGPVDERAWCFQEGILSGRMIVYGTEQMSFRCQQRNIYEDGYSSKLDWGQNGRYVMPNLPSLKQSLPTSKEVMLRRWYTMLAQYVERQMWSPHDVFPALSGIAQLARSILGCRYLAGLWEDDMIRGLLWKSCLLFGPTSKAIPLKRPIDKETQQRVDRAPSWSWAAVEGPLWLEGREMQENKFRNPDNYRAWPVDQINHRWDVQHTMSKSMNFCELQMLGTLKQVYCSWQATTNYTQWPKRRFSRGKMQEHMVLLMSAKPTHADSSLERVVAFGLFDVKEEQATELYCVRLISEEGLMLRKTNDGTFRRLGFFLVEDAAWFDQGVVTRILLR